MKNYTDIDQSKKLAKILPLESADMWYSYYGNTKYNPTIAYKGQQWFLCQIRNSLHDDIPCWSLTALLGVLPKYELNNFGNAIQLDVEREALETEGDETLLDLVVNMIIYLHELKRL